MVFYDFTDNDRDTWPAGYAGLFVGPQSSAAATEFDDVTMWIDNDSDGTIDEQQFADDFSSNEVTLTYDDNGNLTYDGVFTYVYDAQNRVVEAQRVSGGDTTTVASYAYYPDNRRAEKIVQNSGPEIVENDGGNTTVRFYYAGIDPATSRWNIVETRNGSNQATFQYVWGTQYVDELVLIDKNLEVTVDSDSDPDVTSTAETNDGDSPDSRYLVHQDRNWNVVALTDYDPDSTVEGAVVERYSYTPYGEVTVLNGVGTGSSEFGNVRVASSVGNVFHHQGLPLDYEKGSYHNRNRDRIASASRFAQPDHGERPRAAADVPQYVDGMSLTVSLRANPVRWLDPSGRCCICGLNEAASAVLAAGPYCAALFARYAAAAATAAESTGLPGPHNGQQDAFRHCYWSCLMATSPECDQHAAVVGDIHERCNPGPAGEEHMDQHNNKIGRHIGSLPGANANTCYDDCYSWVVNAGANNPGGPWMPQTTPGGPRPPNPYCD